MCLTWKTTPDDPIFENMDPITWLWFYEGWVHEQELKTELSRAQAILIGSFTNPEMAQKMVKRESPDVVSTEIDEELSIELVRRAREEEMKRSAGHRRGRKRKVVRE